MTWPNIPVPQQSPEESARTRQFFAAAEATVERLIAKADAEKRDYQELMEAYVRAGSPPFESGHEFWAAGMTAEGGADGLAYDFGPTRGPVECERCHAGSWAHGTNAAARATLGCPNPGCTGHVKHAGSRVDVELTLDSGRSKSRRFVAEQTEDGPPHEYRWRVDWDASQP